MKRKIPGNAEGCGSRRSRLAEPRVAAVLAALCCILWGSAYPGVKSGYELLEIGAGDTAEKLLFAGLRFSIAGAAVLLWGLVSRPRSGARGRFPAPADLGRIALLGFFQTTVEYVFFYIGLSNTSGAKGSIMNATGVFFSAILAHLIYRDDRLDPRKLVGIIVGFAGVIAVNISDGFNLDLTLQGEGFIAIAAFSLSAASIYGKRLTRRLDPVTVTGGQLLFGGLVLCAAGVAGGSGPLPFTPASAAVLAYLAALSAVAFTIWTALLKHNKVSSITVFNFLIPVSGAILSALILGDSILELRYLVALPAVCAGVLLVNGSAAADGRRAFARSEERIR